MNLNIREIQASDYPLIKEFTFHSMDAPPDEEPYDRSFLDHPVVVQYYENFGKQKGDLAVVAELEGEIIGIAWMRIMAIYGETDPNSPVLCMAVLPDHRSKGIGTKLLDAILELTQKSGYKQSSLTAHVKKPVQNLYKRVGYEVVKLTGQELLMVKKFD